MRISTGADGHRSSVNTSSVDRSHGSTPNWSLIVIEDSKLSSSLAPAMEDLTLEAMLEVSGQSSSTP